MFLTHKLHHALLSPQCLDSPNIGQRGCNGGCIYAPDGVLEGQGRGTICHGLQRGDQEEQRFEAVACIVRYGMGIYWGGGVFMGMGRGSELG